MTATFTIENATDELLKAFKSMAKATNAKFKVDKKGKHKAKEPEFYTLESSPAVRAIDKWEKTHPKEAAQARKDALKEMGLL